MIPGQTTKISESLVASAATISPLTDFVMVSGTTSVATIVPPPNFGGRSSGIMIIMATHASGFATLTTGNISAAVSLTTGVPVLFVYSSAQTKWYPGALA